MDDFVAPVTTRRRAIVVGGGIAGLLASRVLADHFDQVLLLERDRFPDGPEPRAGIPQVRHVHILLLRGKQILEDLFPGLSRELMDHGAGVVEMGQELAVLSYYGWRVRYTGGLGLLTFTRSLLDWRIRRRLAAIGSLQHMDGCRVTGLLADDEGNRVTGIRCQFSHDSHSEQELYGEFVVDASGRFSRAPEWLATLGYDRPEETVVTPFLGYASRLYEAPEGSRTADAPRRGWKGLLLLGKPPDATRGGVLLPVEGNRWHVTLVGAGKDYPPTDETAFLEFARTLRSRILYNAIKHARPLSPISGYQATENRRRHYESLPRWPAQFVVLGDALCTFNPIYGQGISVAALEAVTLDRCLQEYDRCGGEMGSGDMAGLARKVQQQAAHAIKTPWLMATSDDLRWPATEGGHSDLSTRLMHRYLDGIIALATEDPVIDRTFAEVAHLIKPAYTLLHPRIAARVVARLLNPFATNQ